MDGFLSKHDVSSCLEALSFQREKVGFGQSYINLSNSIPISINVKGFLTIFIELLFILLISFLNFQRVLIQRQRIPNTFSIGFLCIPTRFLNVLKWFF